MRVMRGPWGVMECRVYELQRSLIKIRLGWSIRITQFPVFLYLLLMEDTKFHETHESGIRKYWECLTPPRHSWTLPDPHNNPWSSQTILYYPVTSHIIPFWIRQGPLRLFKVLLINLDPLKPPRNFLDPPGTTFTIPTPPNYPGPCQNYPKPQGASKSHLDYIIDSLEPSRTLKTTPWTII